MEHERESKEQPRRGRAPGPLRLAVTRAVQDWYYGLIPFAVLNLLWLLLVLTIVGAPPATAALLGVARDAARGYGAEPGSFFIYLRRFFLRAWKLGLVTFFGTLLLLVDLRFYADLMSGNPTLFVTGIYFLVYVLIVWLEFLLIAWPLLVDRPEMAIREVMRSAAILTLRMPGANFGLALIVLLLCLLSLTVAIFAALALAALVSLLAQHYLSIQAPAVANLSSRFEEVPVPADGPE